jgi:hypothetical protein
MVVLYCFLIVWAAFILLSMGVLAVHCVRAMFMKGGGLDKWEAHLAKENQKYKERRKRRDWHVLREE